MSTQKGKKKPYLTSFLTHPLSSLFDWYWNRYIMFQYFLQREAWSLLFSIALSYEGFTYIWIFRYDEDWACLGPGAVKGLSFALRGEMNQSDGTKYLARNLYDNWQWLLMYNSDVLNDKLIYIVLIAIFS